MHYGEPDFWNKIALLAIIGIVLFFCMMSFQKIKKKHHNGRKK